MNETKKREWTERDFQTHFTRWLKGAHKQTGAFELKVTDDSSLPFNHLQPHQLANLLTAKHYVFAHKIPDLGQQNPFDVFTLAGVPAYIVVMFRVKDWNQKEFFMIDVDVWRDEVIISERKSLTEERARQIGSVHRLA